VADQDLHLSLARGRKKQMKELLASALAIGLAVFGVAQPANAAECFKSDRTFPDCFSHSDKSGGSCGINNRVSGGAFYTDGVCSPIDPNKKAVSATKEAGTQSSFVSGVTSSGAAMSNCTVVVSSPVAGASQHSKVTFGGCASAVKWRIRMFD
jgi:hypothetical protein